MPKNKPNWAHKKSAPIAPVVAPVRTPLARKDKLVFLLIGIVIVSVSAFMGVTSTGDTGTYMGKTLYELESILSRRAFNRLGILSWELIEGNETLTLVMEIQGNTSAEDIELWGNQFKQEASSRLDKAGLDWECGVEVR